MEEKSRALKKNSNALVSETTDNDEIEYTKGQIEKTTHANKLLE